MIEGRFAFHPELANQIFGAVDQEVAALIKSGEGRGDPDFVTRRYDRNQLAAEALGNLVGGGHQQLRPLEADIRLIVEAQTATTGELHDGSVCETSDGLDLPPASVRRLLCQGRVAPIIIDSTGKALDAGRTIRKTKQRRALRAMYRCCAFDGCDVTFDRCEIHHVLPWEFGGPTDLHNLLPLRSRHHHVVHDGGWHLQLGSDRELTITRPDGEVLSRSHPDIAEQHTRRRQPAA